MSVSQQVSLRDVQFSENDPKIIVILAGEFVAKQLSTLSSTEGKSRRSQFIDCREVERDVTGWLIT
jgi:hypothetical protein